jgi:hypothetical protein
MRMKQVLAFFGAAAVSSLALAEPAAPVSVSDDGNTVFVRGDASPLMHLSPGQAENMQGSFKLEDGRMLRLTHRNSKVFMEVDGQREELLPLSPTEFVARKSGARLALDEPSFTDKIQLTQFRK